MAIPVELSSFTITRIGGGPVLVGTTVSFQLDWTWAAADEGITAGGLFLREDGFTILDTRTGGSPPAYYLPSPQVLSYAWDSVGSFTIDGQMQVWAGGGPSGGSRGETSNQITLHVIEAHSIDASGEVTSRGTTSVAGSVQPAGGVTSSAPASVAGSSDATSEVGSEAPEGVVG